MCLLSGGFVIRRIFVVNTENPQQHLFQQCNIHKKLRMTYPSMWRFAQKILYVVTMLSINSARESEGICFCIFYAI